MSRPAPGPALPDLLYLVHRLPYPPDKGDRIRAFHLVRYLSRHANVHLACLADEPVAASSLEALGRYCKRLAVIRVKGWARWGKALLSLARGRTASEGAFASRAFGALVQQWASETRFQAALASSSGVAPYLRLPRLAGVPAVIDLVDVDSQKWLDYAAG